MPRVVLLSLASIQDDVLGLEPDADGTDTVGDVCNDWTSVRNCIEVRTSIFDAVDPFKSISQIVHAAAASRGRYLSLTANSLTGTLPPQLSTLQALVYVTDHAMFYHFLGP